MGWRGVGVHKPGDVSVSGLNVNLFETKTNKMVLCVFNANKLFQSLFFFLILAYFSTSF